MPVCALMARLGITFSKGTTDLRAEIIKQGGRFGVRLKATAPSLHVIKANIETEISPIVGSEKQSEDLVEYLMSEFESDPKKIWESNIQMMEV